jgi:hypothetical protein
MEELSMSDAIAVSPVNETEVSSQGDSVTQIPEPVNEPAVDGWMSLSEIHKLESFQKLSNDGKMLLLEFWRTGSRLKAVESVWDVTGEAARIASYQFDRGNLAAALDEAMGKSERDRFLTSLARAVRSRKTTRNQVESLKLQAKVLGFVDDEKGESQ